MQINYNINKYHTVNHTTNISKQNKNIPKSHKYISILSNWIAKEKFFVYWRALRHDYSYSEVVFLGRITSKTNKVSDSRDETLLDQVLIW